MATTAFSKSIVELTKIERDGNGAQNTDAGRQRHEAHRRRAGLDELCGDSRRASSISCASASRSSSNATATDLKAECYIPSTVSELVPAGEARVKVLRSRDSWFGVTYREDRPRVVESIRRAHRRRRVS